MSRIADKQKLILTLSGRRGVELIVEGGLHVCC
jgi:hypothetical protein